MNDAERLAIAGVGATERDILRLAFVNALRVGAIGVGVGVVAAMLATRFVANQLFAQSLAATVFVSPQRSTRRTTRRLC